MEILTLLAAIASIIGGLAIVCKVIKWAWKTHLVSRSIKKETNKFINLSLNQNFHLAMDEKEFKKAVHNLLFASRSNEDIKIKICIRELDLYRKKYNALIKKGDLSEEELKQRSQLQILLNHIDNRIRFLIAVLSTLFKYGQRMYSHGFLRDDDWITIIKSVIENISQIGQSVQGSKIDVWREKPNRFSAPIYVSPMEMNSILGKFNLSHVQQFMGNMGFLAGELPREILISKIIPSISVNVASKAIEMEENEALSCYDPFGWGVGLG